MKKKGFIFLMLVMISVCMLTGCSSKSKEKEVIVNTKSEVEKIVSSAVNSYQNYAGATATISQDYFSSYFLTASYDLTLELEEQYNNGKKVFVLYSNEQYNGKTVGKDANDKNKYYIYIGSENYKDMWAYATIDLNTGNVSWEDNY